MKTPFGHRNIIVSIFGVVLLIYGAQRISYAQEANPTITASVQQPLTESTLHGSVVTLTLSGATYERSTVWIRDEVTPSGITGVSVDIFDVDRVSDTEVTVELTFNGNNIEVDTPLIFTVEAEAIADYNGPALTTQLPVTAVKETLVASTDSPLTETSLNGSVVTLTLSGRQFIGSERYIKDALTISGIEGVTVATERSGFTIVDRVDRVSDTEVTIKLAFNDDFDTDTPLIFTVEARAIEGYIGPALTAQIPVTAVAESLTASTEFPLTEANLDGSVVTLSLSGRQFVEQSFGQSEIADALTFSGIEGIAVSGDFFYSDLGGWVVGPHVSDNTELTVRLAFNGNFDTDATLTITVGAEAIVDYNKDFTVELPVAAVEQSDATVSISPSLIALPAIGKKLTLNLDIANGENVAGYQATLAFSFDRRVLRYVEGGNGDYLPANAFFTDPIIYHDRSDRFFVVTIAGNTLAEASNGDGTLATLTFEVVDYNPSTVTLSNVYLVDADGKRWEVTTENGEVIEPPGFAEKIFGDINLDGVVNIQDLAIVSNRFGLSGQRSSADVNGDSFVNIVDLVLVANAFGADAAAPALNPQILEQLTAADVKGWLTQARQLALTDPAYLRGISVLEQLLMALTPKETVLLPNYPNPFNPETWIPYHLSKDADVTLRIYAMNGTLVRTLALGHQPAGIYQNRSRAAYWDGKNAFGEPVASGVYFYTLKAGDFTATRKMLIRK